MGGFEEIEPATPTTGMGGFEEIEPATPCRSPGARSRPRSSVAAQPVA